MARRRTQPCLGLSAEGVEELQRILSKFDADTVVRVVWRLGMLVRDHKDFMSLYHGQGSQDTNRARKPSAEVRREIKRIQDALQRLGKSIETVGHHARSYLQQQRRGDGLETVAAGMARTTVWDDLRYHVGRLSRRIAGLDRHDSKLLRRRDHERAVAGSARRSPGRPKMPERDSLAYYAATILYAEGIPIAKSKDGTFARVMMTLLTETEGCSPENVLPLITLAVDDTRKLEVSDCQRYVEERFPMR